MKPALGLQIAQFLSFVEQNKVYAPAITFSMDIGG